MKKIVYISVVLSSLFLVISCEKDFREIGGNIINNNSFETKQVTFEVEIIPENIDAVRADNIAINQLGEYWLGVYNNSDYKRITSSFVSQLGFIQNPKTSDVVPASSIVSNGDETDEEEAALQAQRIDSFFVLDRVILKLPYTATSIRESTDNVPKFRLDSILGDATRNMPLKVYRNETFLNSLNPGNPSESNSFLSDADYTGTEVLNEDMGFEFFPNPNDTLFVYDRNVSNTSGVVTGTYKDTLKLTNANPFLTVPLNTARMKELFWDKFGDPEFATANAFNDYFRGLVVKTEGTEGSMIPFRLLGTNTSASLEFFYTITRYEIKAGESTLSPKDTIGSSYTFPLTGVRNSKYEPNPATNAAPVNSFVVQGTAGSKAKINILNGTELQDLRSRNILVNDASLIFNIDASRDTTYLPLRLLIYKDNGEEGEQITDSYSETNSFGGFLADDADGKPESYTIRITDYISDLLNGTETDNLPLVLRVYNIGTDSPIVNGLLDIQVRSYNWDPRGVTLFNNSTTNGEKRAKLVLSYSEEKENN
ncbi:DUF4270 family protein [Tenacibaculum amylolyticum]|uniref:DUF4270 family protein n=1 Tax=Tenacibaculum amylolyticum TaxID=104269 RepID=UPI0038951C9F